MNALSKYIVWLSLCVMAVPRLASAGGVVYSFSPYWEELGDRRHPDASLNLQLELEASKPLFILANGSDGDVKHLFLRTVEVKRIGGTKVSEIANPGIPMDWHMAPAFVTDTVTFLQVDLRAFQRPLVDKLGEGDTLCRIKVALWAVDPKTSKFVRTTHLRSDWFAMTMAAGKITRIYDPGKRQSDDNHGGLKPHRTKDRSPGEFFPQMTFENAGEF